MKRFITIVAATVAAAAITIPAGANDEPKADGEATFLSCLRAHGLDIPADTQGVDAKMWIRARADDPAVQDALKACQPRGVVPTELIACLRAHGLNPPTAIDQLKPWLAQQGQSAALTACGIDGRPDETKKPDGGCGAGQPAPKADTSARRPVLARQ